MRVSKVIQSWVQVELHRQGVENLPTTIVMVDGLVDFKSALSSGNGIKNKDDNKGKGKGHWKDKKKNKYGNKHPGNTNNDGSGKFRQNKGGNALCESFIYGGPYHIKEYPKFEKLKTIMANVR